MTAYTAATATCASYETIRDAAMSDQDDKPARTTNQPYRDVLERLFLLDPVPAWLPTRNRIARAGAASETSPRRSGAGRQTARSGCRRTSRWHRRPAGPARRSPARQPLRIARDALRTRSRTSREARVFHLRTKSSEREVDLVVERGDGRILAIEAKLGGNVDEGDVRHLRWLAGTSAPTCLTRSL